MSALMIIPVGIFFGWLKHAMLRRSCCLDSETLQVSEGSYSVWWGAMVLDESPRVLGRLGCSLNALTMSRGYG